MNRLEQWCVLTERARWLQAHRTGDASIFFSAGKVPMLSVKLKKAEDPLKLATQLVGVYAALRAQTAGT